MREEFETAVDVILDNKHTKGRLTWKLEMDTPLWGVKAIRIYPCKLELKKGELPNFLRERGFGEVFGEIGVICWRSRPDGLSSAPAFAPDMVVIKSDTKTLILYMEIR